MSGQSDQEKASGKLYSQVSGYNPKVKNRYDNPNALPFSGNRMITAFNNATNKGVKDLKRSTTENVNRAQKSTTAGLQSRGYGGSILEDAIAKARAEASGQGTNAIRSLMTNRLNQLPGLMQQGNLNQLAMLSGATGVDFGNVKNMFNKFGMEGGAIQGLSDDTWLDDLLAVANTAGGFVPLFG